MSNTATLLRAAKNVLEQCLGLRASQSVLIIVDVNAIPVADIITAAAFSCDIAATTIYVPLSLQNEFREDSHLPPLIESSIKEADAVLSCLSDLAEHTAFRLKILEASVGAHRKTAHAPGLTLDILQMVDIDYELLLDRCQMLARAFVIGNQIEIITQDIHGNVHVLHAQLGRWEMPPGISSGFIANGEWANLPPGETFIVPLFGQGEIVINGSLPDRVLRNDEELLLRFENGRCIGIESATNQDLVDYLYRTQFAKAEALGDENWRNFAEIGFGVNDAIDQLTGVELIDEKKFKTIHIGLGRSDFLGGNIYSVIHCDLVVKNATVTIDNTPILSNGNWSIHNEDWLHDYHTVQVPVEWWRGLTKIRRSGSRVEVRDGLLWRIWGTSSGRGASMPVGNRKTAFAVQKLYQLLKPDLQMMQRQALVNIAKQNGFLADDVPKLLWIMDRYDLVRYKERIT